MAINFNFYNDEPSISIRVHFKETLDNLFLYRPFRTSENIECFFTHIHIWWIFSLYVDISIDQFSLQHIRKIQQFLTNIEKTSKVELGNRRNEKKARVLIHTLLDGFV